MQAQKHKPVEVPVAAAPGVEPELFCAAPRRVVPASGVFARRLLLTNLVAGLAFLAYHLAVAPDLYGWRDLTWACLFVIMITVISWLVWEARIRRDVSLLRHGYATRATVTEYTESHLNYDGETPLKYQYESSKRQTLNGYLYITRAETERYGFAAGATFSVLIAPGDVYNPVPYFRVTEATIPGAPPAKIALP